MQLAFGFTSLERLGPRDARASAGRLGPYVLDLFLAQQDLRNAVSAFAHWRRHLRRLFYITDFKDNICGKAKVCKTFIRRYNSDPRLQFFTRLTSLHRPVSTILTASAATKKHDS